MPGMGAIAGKAEDFKVFPYLLTQTELFPAFLLLRQSKENQKL